MMKARYLNGLSKVMLALYGAAIVFGPPGIAQWIADLTTEGGAGLTVRRAIWAIGTFYFFCICPFVLSAVVRRWRSVILEIVEK